MAGFWIIEYVYEDDGGDHEMFSNRRFVGNFKNEEEALAWDNENHDNDSIDMTVVFVNQEV